MEYEKASSKNETSLFYRLRTRLKVIKINYVQTDHWIEPTPLVWSVFIGKIRRELPYA